MTLLTVNAKKKQKQGRSLRWSKACRSFSSGVLYSRCSGDHCLTGQVVDNEGAGLVRAESVGGPHEFIVLPSAGSKRLPPVTSCTTDLGR